MISKKISDILSGKQSQKLLDHAKQSAGDAFLVALKRRAIQKAAKVNSDLIGNNNNFQKIYEKIIQRE